MLWVFGPGDHSPMRNARCTSILAENQANQASFKAMRRRAAAHPVEEVGAKLRAMMPWIGAQALVDKSKN